MEKRQRIDKTKGGYGRIYSERPRSRGHCANMDAKRQRVFMDAKRTEVFS